MNTHYGPHWIGIFPQIFVYEVPSHHFYTFRENISGKHFSAELALSDFVRTTGQKVENFFCERSKNLSLKRRKKTSPRVDGKHCNRCHKFQNVGNENKTGIIYLEYITGIIYYYCKMNGKKFRGNLPIKCQTNACTGAFWPVQDFPGSCAKNALVSAATQEA